MAKRINSLAPTTRKIIVNSACNTKKAPSKNSPKGLRSKEELNRRAIKDVNTESYKRPARCALKKALGSQERERKPILPASFFKSVSASRGRGLTPRQIKRLWKRPEELSAALSKFYNRMTEEQISSLAKHFEIENEECEPGLKAA